MGHCIVKEWIQFSNIYLKDKKNESNLSTSTPGKGSPTKPGLLSPLRGFDSAMPNCKKNGQCCIPLLGATKHIKLHGRLEATV